MSHAADITAIQQLKARYAHFADSKYTQAGRRQTRAALNLAARAQANCFTADAVWDGGKDFGQRLVGRGGPVQVFSGGSGPVALAHYVFPVIRGNSGSATGWLASLAG